MKNRIKRMSSRALDAYDNVLADGFQWVVENKGHILFTSTVAILSVRAVKGKVDTVHDYPIHVIITPKDFKKVE